MYNYELQKEAKERMKEIVMKMNGLTEDDFLNKYLHDVMFHKGFDLLVDLFLQAKFN
ncbi:hypothetical protein [Paenibacillus sp. ISL-20]|uniref:hypothetical protein n=1 Tax=Paenibacillus sp. ISL-20 TaxID=2819163 RepID=UPI001BE7CFAF|nr:hypothetical protein [Paenibacillus sp. ISL-20]MBT2759900.1 hypothetical protein [Paenibacillus sp. ISL-20]